MMTLTGKNIILFVIKLTLIQKKNFIVSLSTIRKFLKTKRKSYSDEVTDFYNKEIPKLESNDTCLAVISMDSAFKKDEIIRNYF